MYIKNIFLENYRNIENIEFSPCNGVNVIYGDNAQGKTNILESVWLITGCKSFRSCTDDDLINFNKDFSNIKVDYFNDVRDIKTEICITHKKKGAKVNGVLKKSTRELMGTFLAVIFSPSHLSLVQDGPSERRKFLDIAISQINVKYAENLKNYNTVLKQKSAYLKDEAFLDNFEMLNIYNEKLSEFGSYIIFERSKYINELSGFVKDIYSGISENKEKIKIIYKNDSNLDGKNIGEIRKSLFLWYESKSQEEKKYKTSLVGPQKDDIEILINNISARKFGSQGQQRSCALALKLAESKVLESRTGHIPIAILDDVMSELDVKRQEYILNHINNRQVFITCCDPSQVIRQYSGSSFLVEKGKIIKTEKFD